jgi:hypothetical protein
VRVEALDLQLGNNLVMNSRPSFSYELGKNGEVYIMTGTGRSYIVNSVEEAEQLIGQISPSGPLGRHTAIRANGLLDLNEVVRLLDVGKNKIKILRLLTRGELVNILYLLPKELLVNALRLFNKAKLLRLIMALPKPFLLKMLLSVMKLDTLIKKMPTNELMRILRSKKLNNRELTKGLQKMEPQFIQLLLQRVHGNYDYSGLKPYELAQIFMRTPKERLMEGFKTLPFKALVPFVAGFVKEDPSLLINLSDDFMAKLFERMSKPMLLKSCMVLPEEILVKMLGQLPTPLLVVAASQIDDKTFQEYLLSQQPQLLKMLSGAA